MIIPQDLAVFDPSWSPMVSLPFTIPIRQSQPHFSTPELVNLNIYHSNGDSANTWLSFLYNFQQFPTISNSFLQFPTVSSTPLAPRIHQATQPVANWNAPGRTPRSAARAARWASASCRPRPWGAAARLRRGPRSAPGKSGASWADSWDESEGCWRMLKAFRKWGVPRYLHFNPWRGFWITMLWGIHGYPVCMETSHMILL